VTGPCLARGELGTLESLVLSLFCRFIESAAACRPWTEQCDTSFPFRLFHAQVRFRAVRKELDDCPSKFMKRYTHHCRARHVFGVIAPFPCLRREACLRLGQRVGHFAAHMRAQESGASLPTVRDRAFGPTQLWTTPGAV